MCQHEYDEHAYCRAEFERLEYIIGELRARCDELEAEAEMADEARGAAEMALDIERERVEELEHELRLLREVRAPGTCQCGDDEACRFVRERDSAMERCESLESALREVWTQCECPKDVMYSKDLASRIRALLDT